MAPRAMTAGLTGLLLTTGAAAQPVLTSVDRFILVSTEGGSTLDGPYTFTGPVTGPWTAFEGSAVFGDNGGSTGGFNDTNIAPGAYTGQVDARADAFGDGADIANSYCQTHFEIEFALPGGGDYTLDGFVNAFGELNGETSDAYIELVDLSTNTPIWSQFISDGFLAFSEAGTLPAGSYRFEADTLAIVDRTFEEGFGDSNATVNFNLTVTPSPASASLIALGMLGCAARRRR